MGVCVCACVCGSWLSDRGGTVRCGTAHAASASRAAAAAAAAFAAACAAARCAHSLRLLLVEVDGLGGVAGRWCAPVAAVLGRLVGVGSA